MTADWIKVLLDLIPAITIVLGGLYTLYEYRRFRRYSPKIQFNIDFNLYPIENNAGLYLIDITMTVKNVGQVRIHLPEIFVGVNTIGEGDLEMGLETQERFSFGKTLIENANMARKRKNDPWWVDPGVTQVFPVPLVIKEPNGFVQVNANINYYYDIDKYNRAKTDEERKKCRKGFHQASIVKPIKVSS